MADLRYTVDIDTRGAQQSLNNINRSIAGIGALIGAAFSFKEIVTISARFEDLRITLQKLYGSVEDGSAAFEQIKAFASSTIFNVEDLTASVIKLKAAGLEPTIKQLRLFGDVAAVSSDSIGVLQAITDLYARTTAGGLGLEDLNRLADRGIPVFTILKDRLGITRLEVSKLGQSAEGASIILQALEEGLSETFSGTMADKAGTLQTAMSNLEDAFGNLSDTLGQGGLNAALVDVLQSITKFLEDNEKFINAIGAGLAAAIKFAVDNLKILAIAFAAAVSIQGLTALGIAVKGIYDMAKATKAAATGFAILQGVTGVGVLKVAAGMAAIAGTIELIDQYTNDATDGVSDLNEEIKKLEQSNIPAGPLIPEVKIDPDVSGESDAKSRLDALRAKQDEVTKSAINYFEEYKEGVANVVQLVEQESELLGLTKAQANVQRELNAFTQRYYDTVNPLQREITELRAKDTQESRAQADEIEKQIGLITDLYNETLGGLRQELELREEIRQQQEASMLLTDNHRKLQQDFNDMIREADDALQDLKLTPFERELEGIRRSIDDKLAASIRKIKYLWEDGLITTDQYLAEIKVLENEATKAFEKITETAKQQREYQRSFEYGWKEAFQSYQDNATNAAKKAGEVFNKVTKGMEDTIVNFVKTGKLEFKDLINDILEQLLRSQIQQLIAQTFGSFGKGGGGGSLGNMFAGFFANGGMIPAGTFGVVGENGPELVSGPGTVTPLGAGGGNVTYNINAVDARSFKQLVASDPGFIHAVASQGARKVPVGR